MKVQVGFCINLMGMEEKGWEGGIHMISHLWPNEIGINGRANWGLEMLSNLPKNITQIVELGFESWSVSPENSVIFLLFYFVSLHGKATRNVIYFSRPLACKLAFPFSVNIAPLIFLCLA